MQEQQLLERITINPQVMAGKPVIRGTRLTVEYILNLLAHGASVEEIIAEYSGLTAADIMTYADRLPNQFVVVSEKQVRFSRLSLRMETRQ